MFTTYFDVKSVPIQINHLYTNLLWSIFPPLQTMFQPRSVASKAGPSKPEDAAKAAAKAAAAAKKKERMNKLRDLHLRRVRDFVIIL